MTPDECSFLVALIRLLQELMQACHSGRANAPILDRSRIFWSHRDHMLFFEATNLVKHDHQQLAVVEATQAGEVLFTLFGGCLFLGDRRSQPHPGFVGVFIVIVGIVGNSLLTSLQNREQW
ncbi:MAG: multidrug resistance efflux transporter family protein [Streptococcus parasanguinis]